MESVERVLILPSALRDQLVDQARRDAPRECCGLLAGVASDRGDMATRVYPLINEARHDDEYLVEAGLFAPFKAMRERGEELVAIYHSHPHGPAVPSATDQARNYYPDVVHVIIALAGDAPRIEAFLIRPDGFNAVRLAE